MRPGDDEVMARHWQMEDFPDASVRPLELGADDLREMLLERDRGRARPRGATKSSTASQGRSAASEYEATHYFNRGRRLAYAAEEWQTLSPVRASLMACVTSQFSFKPRFRTPRSSGLADET